MVQKRALRNQQRDLHMGLLHLSKGSDPFPSSPDIFQSCSYPLDDGISV